VREPERSRRHGPPNPAADHPLRVTHGGREGATVKPESLQEDVMFMRRRRSLRAAVIGGGAYGAGNKPARRSAEQAQPGQQAQQQDDEQNERIATDPEFTAAQAKLLSG
jgi:hypothetical protein